MSNRPWLIVGLGNPGPKYSGNRHNVGHMVLDVLAGRGNASFVRHRTNAHIAQVRLGMLPGGVPGPQAILARSDTYMNTSGGPVAGLLKYFDLTTDNLIVIHDELDIPFDSIRIKRGGGEGGHNGLRDISKAIGTKDYLRVRIGVGRPPGRMQAADWVLKDFGTAERADLPILLEEAADAVEMVITEGMLAAQQKFHSKDS